MMKSRNECLKGENSYFMVDGFKCCLIEQADCGEYLDKLIYVINNNKR